VVISENGVILLNDILNRKIHTRRVPGKVCQQEEEKKQQGLMSFFSKL
jgi:hypothetical protein